MRLIYLGLGWLMVVTGLVGAFLPVLPTTPFLLLAVWCFARSSPALETWLYEHPRFGRSLRNWRDNGAIPKRARIAAVSMMALSYGFFLYGTRPSLLVGSIVAAIMLGSAGFVLTRPDPPA